MSQEKFEVISILGPLGSGKTTTLNHLIEHVPASDSYAVVVNDVGENNIDAQRIWDHPSNRSERIIPLTAGCIGCSDVTQFREALEKVHDAGVNILFIEPTGIAPGTEIAEVVRSSGFDLSVLTLASTKTIERDLKWQVLPSQISVADIIGLTHIPEDQDEAEVVQIALEQLPPLPKDMSIELIKPGSTDYFGVLAKLRGMERQLRIGRSVLPMLCDWADHDHTSGCDHSHGISAKSFSIRPNVSIDDIATLLLPYVRHEKMPLLRAKGTIAGIHFDLVGNEWNTQPNQGSQDSSMNVIFGGAIPSCFMEVVDKLAEDTKPLALTADKKSIVKSVSELPVADRINIILERIQQYPAPISSLHGELIPDCEADEGYEIAFWGNQDDVPVQIKHQAMEAYIQFRLSGLHELLDHPDAITNIDEKRSYWLRRYGATLGYNGYYLSQFIDTDALHKIRQHNPARILIKGLLQTTHLAFDEGRAEEKPEFVGTVLSVGISTNDIEADDILRLKQHILRLAKSNSDFYARWERTFDLLLENQ